MNWTSIKNHFRTDFDFVLNYILLHLLFVYLFFIEDFT